MEEFPWSELLGVSAGGYLISEKPVGREKPVEAARSMNVAREMISTNPRPCASVFAEGGEGGPPAPVVVGFLDWLIQLSHVSPRRA